MFHAGCVVDAFSWGFSAHVSIRIRAAFPEPKTVVYARKLYSHSGGRTHLVFDVVSTGKRLVPVLVV